MPEETGGNRMGGFFHAYVGAGVLAFAWLVRGERGRSRRAALGVVLALTAVVSVMPHCHELRYYLVWMIALVSMNLVLLAGREARGGAEAWTVVSAAMLALVVWSTGGWHLTPSRYSFRDLQRDKVDVTKVAGLEDGARLCLLADPWTFLYAAPLREGARYVVYEGAPEEVCALGASAASSP
jgi:hypothetical protein